MNDNVLNSQRRRLKMLNRARHFALITKWAFVVWGLAAVCLLAPAAFQKIGWLWFVMCFVFGTLGAWQFDIMDTWTRRLKMVRDARELNMHIRLFIKDFMMLVKQANTGLLFSYGDVFVYLGVMSSLALKVMKQDNLIELVDEKQMIFKLTEGGKS